MNKLFFLVALLHLNKCSCEYDFAAPIISRRVETGRSVLYGYRQVYPSQASYVVLIQVFTNGQLKSQCHGALIDDGIVLTAASCVFKKDPLDLRVRVPRTTDIPGPLRHFTVNEIIVHEQYNEKDYEHDIALIILNESLALPVTINFATPAVNHMENNGNFSIIGFGFEYTTPTQEIKRREYMLYAYQMRILSHQDCLKNYAFYNHELSFCAGFGDFPRPNGVVGLGDIGIALVSPTGQDKYIIHGVASGVAFRRHDQETLPLTVPSLFTRVMSEERWISGKIGSL